MTSNKTDIKLHYRYWGKAKKDSLHAGADYHLLVYHSLDVAAVGWKLLNQEHKRCKQLASLLKVNPQWLQQWFVFCLCLHDLGKFARSFQGLLSGLSSQLVPAEPRCQYQIRHDTLGLALWQKVLANQLSDVFPSKYKSLVPTWLEVVCGHHGQPPDDVINGMKQTIPALWWVEVLPLVEDTKQLYEPAGGWCIQETSPAEAGKLLNYS